LLALQKRLATPLTIHFLFRDGQFYSARFIGGGNRSSLKKTTDLLQVTDKLYHIEITLVLLPIKNSQATNPHMTVDENKMCT
jgi:hypothetical protein